MGNKIYNSCALIEKFPSKRKSSLKLRLFSLLRCYSHLDNPKGFNPNRSAPWFQSRTIQTRSYSRILCLPRHPPIQSIVSTVMTEWARCCLHSRLLSTTTQHTKGFHNPNTKRVLNISQIFSICSKVLLAHTPIQLQ